MSLKTAIFQHLAASADVKAIVGNRIYPNKSPQDPKAPCIVYIQISGVRDSTQDGLSGFMTSRIQFDCLASTALVAEDLARKVAAAFCSVVRTIGTDDPVDVHGCFADDQVDGWADELELHVTSVDITIQHTEA